MSDAAPQRLVLVTGPSGAGRTTAIHVLEDFGYETIDNLPLSLIPRLLEGPPRPVPLALGLDARNREFSVANVGDLLDRLGRKPEVAPELLFLDCSPEILLRRYSETRRRHPLTPDDDPQAGILAELELLEPLRARADLLMDTSDLSPHDLKAELARWFDARPGRMAVSVQSFSYKRGVPRGLDTMFDVRFLANPHWEAALRPLDGRDPAVQAYVEADPNFASFYRQVLDLVLFVLPLQVDEGKAHLSIGFGCTGGQHRSVTLAEKLGGALATAGWPVSIRHRELEHRGKTTPVTAQREGAHSPPGGPVEGVALDAGEAVGSGR